MFSNTLEVNASDITETTKKTGTWTWNINYKSLSPDYANTIHPVTIDVDEWNATADEDLDQEWWQWYQINGTQSIFTTSKNAYAYKVTLNAPTEYSMNSGGNWHRVALGTLGEMFEGDCVFGTGMSSTMKPSMWYVSENAEKNIYLGIFSYFATLHMDGSFVPITFVTSGSVDYTVTEYTKAEYVQELIANSQYGNELQEESNSLIDEGNELQAENNALQEEANKTGKGILDSITSFFGSFFDNLINSIVSIFIPDSETMSDLFGQLNDFFSETFGFLYYPFELLINFVDMMQSEDDPVFVFPAFEIMGHRGWGAEQIDMRELPLVSQVFHYVRIVTGAILAFAFVNYLRNFFDKRFGGGG